MLISPVGSVGASPPPPECAEATRDLGLALAADDPVDGPSSEVIDALEVAYTTCGPSLVGLALPQATGTTCRNGDHAVGTQEVKITIVAGVARTYSSFVQTYFQVRTPGGSYTYAYDAPPGSSTGGMWATNGGQGTVYVGRVALPGTGGVTDPICRGDGTPCAATGWAFYKTYFSARADGAFSAC